MGPEGACWTLSWDGVGDEVVREARASQTDSQWDRMVAIFLFC
jgi:hypothetical protein